MPRANIKSETKLAKFLVANELSQQDLYYLIQFKTGKHIGMDRISNLVNGKKTNINLDTAKAICKALEVGLDDIIDID
jgi:DNA-binding Xre family transcriptional regulator